MVKILVKTKDLNVKIIELDETDATSLVILVIRGEREPVTPKILTSFLILLEIKLESPLTVTEEKPS